VVWPPPCRTCRHARVALVAHIVSMFDDSVHDSAPVMGHVVCRLLPPLYQTQQEVQHASCHDWCPGGVGRDVARGV